MRVTNARDITRHARNEHMLRTCLSIAPCAYRTHAAHVSRTCYARIENMLRMYHTRTTRVSNTCYARIILAPCAYLTRAMHVLYIHYVCIEHMLGTYHTRTTRVLVTCYARNTNAPRAYRMTYRTQATHVSSTRHACNERT